MLQLFNEAKIENLSRKMGLLNFLIKLKKYIVKP